MNKVIIYIPSMQKDGSVIKDRDSLLNDSLLFFAENYGGATSYNANGSWILSNGKLQVEPVTIIYSHTKKAQKTKLIKHARKLKLACKQDSVLIEVNEEAIFI